ncbi:MAG: hypothetical protein ACLPWD_07420 [Methanobacterium sp.]
MAFISMPYADVIFIVIISGFIVVTIMMEILGKNFSWHEELD